MVSWNENGLYEMVLQLPVQYDSVQLGVARRSSTAPTKGNFGQIGGGEEQAVPSSPVLTKPLSRTVVRVCRAGSGEEEQEQIWESHFLSEFSWGQLRGAKAATSRWRCRGNS